MSDHTIDNDGEDDVEQEHTTKKPTNESHTLGRKRPSPEAEVCDGAKKARTPSSFRTRAYDGLKPPAKHQKDLLLMTSRGNWGMRWEDAIDKDLWLVGSKSKTPQHPKNWSSTVLQEIIQLSALTPKAPVRASNALKEAISRRVAMGIGSARLEQFEDIKIAKEIVVSQSDGPQVGRAPAASLTTGPATIADVLRASATSSATLDNTQTPIRGPARRDSGAGAAPSTSPTRPPALVTGASTPIKYEEDIIPISPLSPRSGRFRRKLCTEAELSALNFEDLMKTYQ